MATRPSAELTLVGITTIVSIIIGVVMTSRSSALTIPVLRETQAAPMQNSDEYHDSSPQVVSWLTFPYSAINKVSGIYDDRFDMLQYNDGPAHLHHDAEAEDVPIVPLRNKKYKLSFYDCISLYCGEKIGSERGQCILRFCHRTK